jgi:hypothetical protein
MTREDPRWLTHTQWFWSDCRPLFWWPKEGDDPPACLTKRCQACLLGLLIPACEIPTPAYFFLSSELENALFMSIADLRI